MKKKKLFPNSLLAGLLAISFLLLPPTYAQGLWVEDLWVGDFEDGKRPTDLGCNWKKAYWDDHSFGLVTSPVRAGRYAGKMYRAYGEPLVNLGARSEITRAYSTDFFGKKTIFDIKGSERWYGFSDYLPSNWVIDNRGPDITMQFHVKSASLGYGRSPAMDIRVSGNEVDIVDRWDGGSAQLWNGPLVTGEWIDWVFHVKWSSQPNGFIEVWRNGVKIVNRFNYPTCYDFLDNDEGTGEGGTFFKTGVYHYSWKSGQTDASERTIYHDEVRVANKNGSFDLVSPSTFRAVATANDTVGFGPHTVNFLGIANNGTPPFEYHWSFGDGDTAIGRAVSHTYTTPHSYVARLKIKDNTGATTAESTYSACKVINVLDSTSFMRCPSMIHYVPGMPFRYRMNYEAPGGISKTWTLYKHPSWISPTMIGQYITGDTIPREVRVDTIVIGLDVDGVEEIKTIYFFIGREIENVPIPVVGIRNAPAMLFQELKLQISSLNEMGMAFNIFSPRKDNVAISVFDIFGRAIWASERIAKQGTNKIDWNYKSGKKSKIVPGMYLVLLKGAKQSVAKKVLVKF